MRLLLLILFMASCTSKNKLEIGNCLGRADEAHIWKILEIKDEIVVLSGQTPGIKNKIFEADIKDHWIQIPCELNAR